MAVEPTQLAILRRLYQSQPVTRRVLAEQSGLSVARVSAHVAELMRRNLVREVAVRAAGLGRPAAPLILEPTIGLAVGVGVDTAESRAVLVDPIGRVVASARRPNTAATDGAAALDTLVGLVEVLCQQAGTAPGGLLAVGVGLLGVVDVRTGVILAWPNTPDQRAWIGLDVPAQLRKRLGNSSVLAEDFVRAMGVTTHRYGLGRGRANVLYVFLGDGIGSALIVDGRLYRGEAGIAGELGHVTIDRAGPLCRCGNAGCLEMFASTPAVLQRLQQRLEAAQLESMLRGAYERGELTLPALAAAARAGDKLAYQILDETGGMVGEVVAMALNLLGPGLVVLGGPLVQGNGIILEAVQRQIKLRALQYVSRHIQVVCDDQGELATARGAATLALDALFNSPEQLSRLVRSRGTR